MTFIGTVSTVVLHYHEGLPIALLEAMIYGLSVLVSDIPANKEVELPSHRYFKCGNVKDLGEKMAALLTQRMTVQEKEALRARIAADYGWSTECCYCVIINDSMRCAVSSFRERSLRITRMTLEGQVVYFWGMEMIVGPYIWSAPRGRIIWR